MVTQRTHNIAWVQYDNDRKFVDPHFVEGMAGVLRGARAGGYDILLTSDTPSMRFGIRPLCQRQLGRRFIVDLPLEGDPRISTA